MTNIQFALHLFDKTRRSIAKTVADLTTEQLLTVPDGFANNILWNLGHIIVVQQGNVYGRSGVEPLIDLSAMRPLFRANTSPDDWTETPDVEVILSMVVGHVDRLSADCAQGKFANITYQARTSGSGVYMTTLEQAMFYNNYHEGLHLGAINALKDFVTK